MGPVPGWNGSLACAFAHMGGRQERAAMQDTILHDRVLELEGKLRNTAPATKSDIDDVHARLAKIEALLDAMCKDMHVGAHNQRSWRFRRGNEHQSRRNMAA